MVQDDELIIRRAESKDVEACVELSKIEEFKHPDGTYPDKGYLQQALDKEFFVAEKNSTIVGLILGYCLTTTSVYLALLCVHENFRSNGTGKQLLEAFSQSLQTKGIKDYFLIAPTSNERTLQFYRMCGLIEGKQYTLFVKNFE